MAAAAADGDATSPSSAETTPSPTPCQLYDGAYNYRLSDITGSRFFRATSGGRDFHRRNFPKSLAVRFLNQYAHGTPNYRKYYNSSCDAQCFKHGYCQCYVPRAHSLHHLLSKEEAPPRLSDTAAIHLRVGDVVDQSPFSIDEMLSRPTKFSTRCTAPQIAAGCLAISPVVYVQPLDRYTTVVEQLRARNIQRVVLVAASSHNGFNYSRSGSSGSTTKNNGGGGIAMSHEKSCEYVKRVGDYFRKAAFTTEYRLGHHPDEDFRFLTRRVGCYVPSLSGFASLAGQVAQKFGVDVVMPKGLTLPTFDLTG